MRLIDADKAYTILTDYYHHKTDIQHQALIEALNRVPTIYPPIGYKVLADGRRWEYFGKEEIDPVRHGRWIKEEDENSYWHVYWHCSECNCRFIAETFEDISDFQYCPHCGAKMEEQE